jgi:hypothetical protein
MYQKRFKAQAQNGEQHSRNALEKYQCLPLFINIKI